MIGEDRNTPNFHITFENVSVSVDDGEGRKNILTNVSGDVKPGEVLGIMGPSGSGKTTLLNILYGKANTGNMRIDSGEVTVSGKAITKRLKRRIGYVQQEDVLFSNLTVKQSLEFVAELRLPDTLSLAAKKEKADHLIDTLGLTTCQNTVIGGGLFTGGISGGEKKRVSIGVELITDPPLIYMDEPTTGLDSSSASSLIFLLKSLAREQKKTIICTIHQPSSQIFYAFDKLLLLCNGRIAYFGPTKDVVKFFADIDLPCHPNWNPADDILEKVKSGKETEDRICSEYEKRATLLRKKDTSPSNSLQTVSDSSSETTRSDRDCSSVDICVKESDSHKTTKYTFPRWESSFLTQVRVLTQRTFLQTKGGVLDILTLVQTALGAIITSLVWFQLPYTETAILDRVGLIFFVATYWMFTSMFIALLTFTEERPVIAKERASGMYRLSAYFVSKCLSELPVMLVQPFAFWTVIYWASGLQRSAAYLSSMAILLLNTLIGQSVGLLITSIVTDLKRSIVVATIIALSFFLMGGFMVQKMPHWLDWVRYFSIATYPYYGMLIVEFTGSKDFRCKSINSEYVSCLQHNNTAISGEEILKQVGVKFELWECIFAMFMLLIFYRSLCYICMRFYNKPT